MPFAALPRDALRIDDALVHRLLLEDAVNSSWIVLHLCVSLWGLERSNLSRIAGCHVIWLLSDELDCRTKEISYQEKETAIKIRLTIHRILNKVVSSIFN